MKRERIPASGFADGLVAPDPRGRPWSLTPAFLDYAVTIAISGAAALLLPFVDDVSRRMPQYSGVLMGGFLALASLSLASFWSRRRG